MAFSNSPPVGEQYYCNKTVNVGVCNLLKRGIVRTPKYNIVEHHITCIISYNDD